MPTILLYTILAAFSPMVGAIEPGQPQDPIVTVIVPEQKYMGGAPMLTFTNIGDKEGERLSCTASLAKMMGEGLKEDGAEVYFSGCARVIFSGWRIKNKTGSTTMMSFYLDDRNAMHVIPPMSMKDCIDYYSSPGYDSSVRPIKLCGLTMEKFSPL